MWGLDRQLGSVIVMSCVRVVSSVVSEFMYVQGVLCFFECRAGPRHVSKVTSSDA